jgi:CelD/BcsL family acetyltransferase involved in cellulose biosynthesis
MRRRRTELRIVCHTSIPEDPQLQRQWNDLVLKMERPEVFYTWEWALAVQAAYKASIKPLLFLGYEGDELVGVASLATDTAAQRITFLGATTADYCDFVSRPEDRRELVNAVLGELETLNSTSIGLANLPEESATIETLAIGCRNHCLYLHMRPAYLCTQVDLGEGERREQLRTALLQKKKLRRYLRELEICGPVTVVHLRTADQIRAALPRFADAHIARFRETNRTSSLSTQERRAFLGELAKRFAGEQVVTLSILMVGERPIAWNYGFRFQGSWFWYMPTFDSSQRQNSPGHCLLARIIIDACEEGEMKRVDLGLGAEGYKERFGNHLHKTACVTLTNSSFRHLGGVVWHRAARILRESPRIESAVRRMLHRSGQDELGDLLAN